MTDTYSDAYHAACRYQQEVIESALEHVREMVAEGQDKNEALEGYATGCETVIYTGRAWCYCFASSNDEAYEEEMGEVAPSIESRAAWAIVADVREHYQWDDIEAPEDDEAEDIPTNDEESAE